MKKKKTKSKRVSQAVLRQLGGRVIMTKKGKKSKKRK